MDQESTKFLDAIIRKIKIREIVEEIIFPSIPKI